MDSFNKLLVEKGARIQLCQPVLNFFHFLLMDIDKAVSSGDYLFLRLRCGSWEGRTQCVNYVPNSSLEWIYHGSEIKFEVSMNDLDDGIIVVELWTSELIGLSKINTKGLEWNYSKVSNTGLGFGLNDQIFDDSMTLSSSVFQSYPSKQIGQLRIVLELRAVVKQLKLDESIDAVPATTTPCDVIDNDLVFSRSNLKALDIHCSVKRPTYTSTVGMGIKSDGVTYGCASSKYKLISSGSYVAADIAKVTLEDSNRVVFRRSVNLVVVIEACGGINALLYVRGYKPDVTSYQVLLSSIRLAEREPFQHDVVYSRKYHSFRITAEHMYDGCAIRIGLTCPLGDECSIR